MAVLLFKFHTLLEILTLVLTSLGVSASTRILFMQREKMQERYNAATVHRLEMLESTHRRALLLLVTAGVATSLLAHTLELSLSTTAIQGQNLIHLLFPILFH